MGGKHLASNGQESHMLVSMDGRALIAFVSHGIIAYQTLKLSTPSILDRPKVPSIGETRIDRRT